MSKNNPQSRRASRAFVTLRARVDAGLKNRLTQFRRVSPGSPSESFIVRRAVEELLIR